MIKSSSVEYYIELSARVYPNARPILIVIVKQHYSAMTSYFNKVVIHTVLSRNNHFCEIIVVIHLFSEHAHVFAAVFTKLTKKL